MQRWLMLAFFLFICFAVEFFANAFTQTSVSTWYTELKKPGWTAPGWLFGPVWTTLYTMMAISMWLVWLRIRGSKTIPYIIFALQLFLNFIWSYLFFTLENPLYGFVNIILLWFAITAMIRVFHPISKTAGWLLAPYLIWVTYALILNYTIWQMN